MTYRDRPIECPRCRVELTRSEQREMWRCDRCSGLLWATGEVIADLVLLAPTLAPHGGVKNVVTPSRRSSEPPLPCPQCAAPMDPVFLGGVEVDRCRADELVWFDHPELERVRARAIDQHDVQSGNWLVRLVKGWLA